MNVPKALRFQGPSCSITDIKGGLNPDMQCTRSSNQLTLMHPFTHIKSKSKVLTNLYLSNSPSPSYSKYNAPDSNAASAAAAPSRGIIIWHLIAKELCSKDLS